MSLDLRSRLVFVAPRVSLGAARHRVRAAYVVCFAIAILLGLASRRYASPLSALFGKYPGDALWAVMVFFGWGALRPRTSSLSVALLALATCFAVEALKLYQAPWIVGIRHTVLGHLVFGHVFSFENLTAYAVGVAVALGIEWLWPFAGEARAVL